MFRKLYIFLCLISFRTCALLPGAWNEPSAINIDTRMVLPLPSPLPYTAQLLASGNTGFLENVNGEAIQITLNQAGQTSGATGGPLGLNKYKLHHFRFVYGSGPHWSNGVATIDGKTVTLNLQFTYYDVKYGNIEIAKNFKGGIEILDYDVPVVVGAFNPLFVPIGKLLSAIKLPNSKVPIITNVFVDFFDFCGILEDNAKGKYYYYTFLDATYAQYFPQRGFFNNAIALVFRPAAPFKISPEQFNQFLQVMNSSAALPVQANDIWHPVFASHDVSFRLFRD